MSKQISQATHQPCCWSCRSARRPKLRSGPIALGAVYTAQPPLYIQQYAAASAPNDVQSRRGWEGREKHGERQHFAQGEHQERAGELRARLRCAGVSNLQPQPWVPSFLSALFPLKHFKVAARFLLLIDSRWVCPCTSLHCQNSPLLLVLVYAKEIVSGDLRLSPPFKHICDDIN